MLTGKIKRVVTDSNGCRFFRFTKEFCSPLPYNDASSSKNLRHLFSLVIEIFIVFIISPFFFFRSKKNTIMPTKCCAFHCKSVLRKGSVKFYRFPTGKHRLTRWLEILKIGGSFDHRKAKICSLHFSFHQFINSGKWMGHYK